MAKVMLITWFVLIPISLAASLSKAVDLRAFPDLVLRRYKVSPNIMTIATAKVMICRLLIVIPPGSLRLCHREIQMRTNTLRAGPPN